MHKPQTRRKSMSRKQMVLHTHTHTHVTMLLYLSQQLGESQDLSDEDSKTNVNAGNEAQEAPQVLRGDLTEVHGHHAERDT